MKKIKTLFIGALLLVAGNAMADKFSVEDVNVEPGSQTEVLVSIENASTIYSFQLDLTLPNGVSLVKDEAGEDYGEYIKARTAKSGTFTFNQYGNTWQIVYFCAKFDDNGMPIAIKGNSGPVMKLFIKPAVSFVGSGEATITNAKTTDETTIPRAAEGCTFKIISSIADGINGVSADSNDAPVYTLGGQRVESPKKGIYVKDGRKVVVK